MAESASDTETTILDATLAEVLEHGIRRTSASDVARRAGVSRQTLYRYWPDAQALFAALVTRELLAELPVVDGVDSLDDTVALLVGTADRIRRLPLVERLRDTDPELFSRYILERLGTSQRAIHALLAAIVADGQATGTVRGGDAGAMAGMVLLIAQSAIQSAPLFAEWLDDDEWRRELAHALAGYLAPAGQVGR
jgi:AcrR family transcriptional regulator